MATFVGDYRNIAKLDFRTDYADHGNPMSVALAILQQMHFLRTGTDPGPLSPWLPLSIKGDLKPFDQLDKWHGFSSSRLIWQAVLDIASCKLAECPFRSVITPAMEEAAKKYRLPIGLKGFDAVPTFDAAADYLAANKGDAIYLGSEGWQAYALLGIDEPSGRVIALTFHNEIREPFFSRLTPANPSKGQVTLLDRKSGADLWQKQLHGQPRMSDPMNYVVVYCLPGASS